MAPLIVSPDSYAPLPLDVAITTRSINETLAHLVEDGPWAAVPQPLGYLLWAPSLPNDDTHYQFDLIDPEAA